MTDKISEKSRGLRKQISEGRESLVWTYCPQRSRDKLGKTEAAASKKDTGYIFGKILEDQLQPEE